MEEQLFNRDAEMAETWMAAREAVLMQSEDDGGSADALLKKHHDFERALNAQVIGSLADLLFIRLQKRGKILGCDSKYLNIIGTFRGSIS